MLHDVTIVDITILNDAWWLINTVVWMLSEPTKTVMTFTSMMAEDQVIFCIHLTSCIIIP